jgi:hypothetical protein
MDHAAEADFFHAMLHATIYSLAPFSDDHPRLRLITFTRPDGVTFIPLFTDEGKAARSAQGAMRVVALTGRELLEGTPGATIVINPNDEHCVLYPEEIVGLLATGFVARVENETTQEPRWIDVEPDVPVWLVTLLQEFFVNLPYVEAVRLVSMGPKDNPAHQVLTLVITCPTMHGERAARATIAAVQPACSAHDLPVDIALAPSDEPDSGLTGLGRTIYERAAASAP